MVNDGQYMLFFTFVMELHPSGSARRMGG